ncbi:MAG TPA: PQQ-dependent sugar dehydrogenase, partial [Gammaproteobacteria bacterium]|nr:PQQ-dependent sugar dehydrogenase [Gammaproteobacteria bacterium]
MALQPARRCAVALALLLLLEACHSSSNDDPPAPPGPNPPTVGLDARPSNLTCVAPAKTPAGVATIQLQRVFPNLSFSQPVGMLQAPGDNSRWFVLEKGGTVRAVTTTANPTANAFITLAVNSGGEGGLLGMAFDPSFATNGFVFLSFTEGSPMVSVVARFTIAPARTTLVTSSRLDILRVNQPSFENHKGGNIAFGPDGFLYLGLGDGGSGGDPSGHAQNTRDLLGDFVRLDVRNATPATPYAIPAGAAGNPFQNNPICPATGGVQSCPEIYASGLRNPWRWSFDTATGDLWVGDVGQNALEEIDLVERGGNYGWNCREGLVAYSGMPASCPATAAGFADPVHDYGRTAGASVTGGYVYRGTALPALVGRYVFGDFVTGRIWRLVPNGSGFAAEELLDTALAISSFGQGNDGELYVVHIGSGASDGQLYKIVGGGSSGAGTPATPVPTLLSATGCVNATTTAQPASGLIPYEPAAAFWSDGATKERWLGLPNSTSISVGSDGDFSFPNGTVLMKHFRLNGNLVETRLFMRHPDGDWAGYSYEWNAQGSDATLVQGGKTVTIGSQSWRFPSGNECLTCHTAAAGFALGVEAAQLNHDLTYGATRRTANQLRTLDGITLFATPLGDPALQPSMPDPADTSAPL